MRTLVKSTSESYCNPLVVLNAISFFLLFKEIRLKSSIINELAKEEKVDENLKQNNQLEWVRCMNNIKNRAEEIVFNELIYV